jgi:hypothetical protein
VKAQSNEFNCGSEEFKAHFTDYWAISVWVADAHAASGLTRSANLQKITF